jgi:hypothetical protein
MKFRSTNPRVFGGIRARVFGLLAPWQPMSHLVAQSETPMRRATDSTACSGMGMMQGPWGTISGTLGLLLVVAMIFALIALATYLFKKSFTQKNMT